MDRGLLDLLYSNKHDLLSRYSELQKTKDFTQCCECKDSLDYEKNKLERNLIELEVKSIDRYIDVVLRGLNND